MTEQELTTKRLYELSRSVREWVFEATFGEPSEEVSVKLDLFLELEEDPIPWVGENLVKAFGQKPIYWYSLVSDSPSRKYRRLEEFNRYMMANSLQFNRSLISQVLRPIIPMPKIDPDDRVDALRYGRYGMAEPIKTNEFPYKTVKRLLDKPTKEDEEV